MAKEKKEHKIDDPVADLEHATERYLRGEITRRAYDDARDRFVYSEAGTMPERKREPKATTIEEAVPQKLRSLAAQVTNWFMPEETEILDRVHGLYEPFTIQDDTTHIRMQFHPNTDGSMTYASQGPNGEQQLTLYRNDRNGESHLTIHYGTSAIEPGKSVRGSVGMNRQRDSKDWIIDTDMWGVKDAWKRDPLMFEDAMTAALDMTQKLLVLTKEHPDPFIARKMKKRR